MRTLLTLTIVAIAAFAGCLGDSTNESEGTPSNDLAMWHTDYNATQTNSHPAYGWPTPTDYRGAALAPDIWALPPAADVPETITGIEHVAQVEGVTSGAGIATFGHFALISGNGPGSIVDIADPTNPVKVADIDVGVRDADVIMYPDGRTVAVMASNGPIHIYDVTDPTNPVQLGDLEVGSHNAVVVPGTPIVYNANSAGGAGGLIPSNPAAWTGDGIGVTEIIDMTDPANPVYLPDFENGYGCHDITFHIDPVNEKYRAYCAGIEMTQIWDIADPLNPVVLVDIPVHHGVAGTPSSSIPLVLFSHLAMVNSDATVLMVGDESGGGLANACDVYADAVVATGSGPTGNIWFYDLSDEQNPQLVSWINPMNPATAPADYVAPAGCTAHFGRLIEDRDVMAMAFYGAGVVLIDFSNLMNPVILDQFAVGTNTWDVWYHNGWLVTGDLERGSDVLRLV